MAKQIIGDAWTSYLEQVVPPTAGPNQLFETRLAFYAGANALLSGMLNGLMEGPLPEPGDFSLMHGIEAELKAFRDSL